MNFKKLLLGGLFLTAPCLAALSQARIYTPDEYDFPIRDGLWATIASALNSTDIPYSTFRLEVRPERKNIPLIENRHRVPVNIFIHNNSQAPLMFVIAGLGGSAFSGTALYIAEQVYQQGYNVMTLPNPVSWQYALGVSSNGAPGYLPHDAIEYYEFLALATEYAKREFKINPSNYGVLGYSYGGLLTAFLTDLDMKKKYFGFKKSVIINPAVDLKYEIAIFDTYYSLGYKWSEENKSALNGLLLDAAFDLLETNKISDHRILTQIQSRKILSINQKKWVISDSFRSDLRDIIFVSQQIKDQGLLKFPASKYLQNARLDEAKQLSFSDYVLKILIPRNQLENEGSTDELLYSASLYPVLERISANQSVYMQESKDDFLLKPGDIMFLQLQLKDRLFLYPYGGHVGNIRFETNKNDLRNILNSN